MLALPACHSLANIPTPLEPLAILGYESGPRIWVKRDDLTGSGLSGNKIRKLEFVVAHALNNNADTLITCGGIQSNHCRATALVGAKLGLKVHLILRAEGDTSIDGNLLIDHLAGATIEVIPQKDFHANLQSMLRDRAAEYASRGRVAHIIPTGASDQIGVWGYIKCAAELKNDFTNHEINPEVIVCATGSGGTQAGLNLGCHLLDIDSQVIGYAVCDDQAYFNNKVQEDISSCIEAYSVNAQTADISIKTNDRYIGPGYAQGYPELYQCIRDVASSTGLLLDPVYTGKAFYGLLTDIKSGAYQGVSDIVFVHTGGTFGLFTHKNAFGFND